MRRNSDQAEALESSSFLDNIVITHAHGAQQEQSLVLRGSDCLFAQQTPA